MSAEPCALLIEKVHGSLFDLKSETEAEIDLKLSFCFTILMRAHGEFRKISNATKKKIKAIKKRMEKLIETVENF